MAAGFCAEPESLWQSTTCFFGLSNGIQTYEDLIGLTALILAAAALLYNLGQAFLAFLLIRRMNPGKKRGTVLAVLRTVAALALRHPLALVNPSWNLFVRARMRAEHEIFNPRPEWEWPDSEIQEEVAEAGRPGWTGWWLGFGRFARARFAWHWQMARIGKQQSIEVKSAGELNDEFENIGRYFEVIKSLAFAERDELSFVCQVEVTKGFIAPLHLLTGLLAQYNEKWDGIIREFELQTGRWDDIPLADEDNDDARARMTARNFRQIQSFIYHCWLLWGPSIPICAPTCTNWGAGYISVQYGFGDENNSIEIVGTREELQKAVLSLLNTYFPGFGGMALPASVTGVLQYSTTATRDSSNIPPLIRKSWDGTQDARPILFYSEKHQGDAVAGRRSRGEVTVGEIKVYNEEAQLSPYYSAYLWVMFVVLRADKDITLPGGEPAWLPLNAGGAKICDEPSDAWKATIPFFEHGNIADAESCGFAKQVLADKVIGAMLQFIDGWDPGSYPLRFAYAAAIDDGNCGPGLLFDSLKGGDTVRERIERRLKSAPRNSRLRRLLDEKIVLFDYFTRKPRDHPYSSCALPAQVGAYYEALGRADQSDRASRKEAGRAPSRDEAERVPESAASSADGSSNATSSAR